MFPMKRALLNCYWSLTRFYLRVRGASVGRGVRCNGFPYVKIRKGGVLIIEDDVMLNAARWANAHVPAGSFNLFVAEGASLVIKKGAGVSGSRLVAMKKIEIGAGSLIGGGCLICDSDMHEVPLGSGRLVAIAPIRIGRDVFVGAHSIILKGVTVGDGTVVGAGSVVTRDLPSGSLACGNPAQVLRRDLRSVDPAESHRNGALGL
jgi:acetyltransferase-like isoleucine patch superfamily enzyme